MPFDGSEYITRPTRSIDEVKADVVRRLANNRSELRIVMATRFDAHCPRQRSLLREIAALRRRLGWLDAEIAQRQRAA